METHGRPPRLRGWDYTKSGAYVVTISVRGWVPCLRADGDPFQPLSDHGLWVEDAWQELPHRHPRVGLDALVIMPDHVHAVIWLRDHAVDSVPLGEVVRGWKGHATTLIKPGLPSFHWKTGFFDRVIRSQHALYAVRRYIRENPLNYKGPWRSNPA
jgi:putative transposase